MSTRFKVGDIVGNQRTNMSKPNEVIYEILETGVAHPTPTKPGIWYTVKVLKSRNPKRIGIIDYKHIGLIDNNYDLTKAPTINLPLSAPPHPSQFIGTVRFTSEVDEKAVESLRAQLKVSLPQCDCGARKCGYRDDEHHAHARWCDIVKRSFQVPTFTEET